MFRLTLVTPDHGFAGKNKRAFPRLDWKVLVQSTSGEGFVVHDFSPGGVGLSSKTQLRPRQFIEFTLNTRGALSPAVLTCQILWVRKDQHTEEYIAGARFVDEPGDKYSLVKYLYNIIKSQVDFESLSFAPINLLSKDVLDKSVVHEIQKIQLPSFFKTLIRPSREFTRRPEYTWKWCYKVMNATSLSSIDTSFRQVLDNTKLASFILSIVLDDLADEKGETTLLAECCKMIFCRQSLALSALSESEQSQGAFINSLWTIMQNNMKQFPRFEEFSEIIYYDFQQIVNTLEYALLSNKIPGMINEKEAVLYEGNNINVMTDLMMDIMCSPSFDAKELGLLREVGWHAQMMCKIANWVSTWRREVRVGDWTSGVIANGLGKKIIQHNDLSKDNVAVLTDAIETSEVEEALLCDWERHRIWIARRCDEAQSVDLRAYLKGLETFYQMQSVSEGMQ